jgi:hypothetical protein
MHRLQEGARGVDGDGARPDTAARGSVGGNARGGRCRARCRRRALSASGAGNDGCGARADGFLIAPGAVVRTRHEPCFMNGRSHQTNHAGTRAISKALLPSPRRSHPRLAVAAPRTAAVQRRAVPSLPEQHGLDSPRGHGERRAGVQPLRRMWGTPAGERHVVRRMRAEAESSGASVLTLVATAR